MRTSQGVVEFSSRRPSDPGGRAQKMALAGRGRAAYDQELREWARATWSEGDYARVAVGTEATAHAFVNRLALAPGERVLDVGSGTGNVALPAAHRGASVVGVDISPSLVTAARKRATFSPEPPRFELASAEVLLEDDGSFDTVVSMFGVMYVVHPERAVAELLRVTRPGGRIVLASWTPRSFPDRLWRLHASYAPPPQGLPSPFLWGDQDVVLDRLVEHRSLVRRVETFRRTTRITYYTSPGGTVELFRECYGPSVRAFATLDAERRAGLSREMASLWAEHNRASGPVTSVDATYLEVVIERA